MQDIPGSAHAGGFGLLPLGPVGQAGRGRVPRARRAASRRSRAAASSTTAGPEIAVAKPLDGLKFVDMIDIDAKGVDSRRRRRHRPHQVLRRRQVRAHVGQRRVRDLPVLGLALLEARQAHADVQGDRRGEQRHHQVGHGLQGQEAAEGQDVGDARARAGRPVDGARHRRRHLARGARLHAPARQGGGRLPEAARARSGRRSQGPPLRRQAGQRDQAAASAEASACTCRFPGVEGFKKSRSKPVRFTIA